MERLRFLMPLAFLAVVALFGAAVMLLWNWLIPTLFGLGTVTFWQAVGLLVLCRILFGGHRFGGRQRGEHFGDWHGRQRGHFHERWQQMNDEERQELRERFKGFHGRDTRKFEDRAHEERQNGLQNESTE